jgi:transcriptional regulator with XRE-family HTH domain
MQNRGNLDWRLELAQPTVGERIREKREEKGWSRSDLAEMLDVTHTAVWNWEERGMVPRKALLEKIAKTLGVHGRYLRDGGANPAPSHSAGVAETIENARQDIAKLLGVPLFRVKLILEVSSG